MNAEFRAIYKRYAANQSICPRFNNAHFSGQSTEKKRARETDIAIHDALPVIKRSQPVKCKLSQPRRKMIAKIGKNDGVNAVFIKRLNAGVRAIVCLNRPGMHAPKS